VCIGLSEAITLAFILLDTVCNVGFCVFLKKHMYVVERVCMAEYTLCVSVRVCVCLCVCVCCTRLSSSVFCKTEERGVCMQVRTIIKIGSLKYSAEVTRYRRKYHI